MKKIGSSFIGLLGVITITCGAYAAKTISETPMNMQNAVRVYYSGLESSSNVGQRIAAYRDIVGGTDDNGTYLQFLRVGNKMPNLSKLVTNLSAESIQFDTVFDLNAAENDGSVVQVYSSDGTPVVGTTYGSKLRLSSIKRHSSHSAVAPANQEWGTNNTTCKSAQHTLDVWNRVYATEEDDIKISDVRYVIGKNGAGSTDEPYENCAIIFRDPDGFCRMAHWTPRERVAGDIEDGYMTGNLDTRVRHWSNVNIVDCNKKYSDLSRHRIVVNINAGMNILLVADKVTGKSYTEQILVSYGPNESNSGIDPDDPGLPDLSPLIELGRKAGLTFNGIYNISYGEKEYSRTNGLIVDNSGKAYRNFSESNKLWNADGSVADAERLGRSSQFSGTATNISGDWGITSVPTSGLDVYADDNCTSPQVNVLGGCVGKGLRCAMNRMVHSYSNYKYSCSEPCETGERNTIGCIPTVEYCKSIDANGFPELYSGYGYPVSTNGVTFVKELLGNCACPFYSYGDSSTSYTSNPSCVLSVPSSYYSSSTESVCLKNGHAFCRSISSDETEDGCAGTHCTCGSGNVTYHGACVPKCPSGQVHVGNLQPNTNGTFNADCVNKSTHCSGFANAAFDENCRNPSGTTRCPAKYCGCNNGYTLINGTCTLVSSISCSAIANSEPVADCPRGERVDNIPMGCATAGCRCKSGYINKNGACIAADTIQCNPACEYNAHCENKQCVCNNGFTNVGGTCMLNCSTNTQCGPGGTCSGGTCSTTCSDPHAIFNPDSKKCECNAAENYKQSGSSCEYNVVYNCSYDGNATVPNGWELVEYQDVVGVANDEVCTAIARDPSGNCMILSDENIAYPIFVECHVSYYHIDLRDSYYTVYAPESRVKYYGMPISKFGIAWNRSNITTAPNVGNILQHITNEYSSCSVNGLWAIYGNTDGYQYYTNDGSVNTKDSGGFPEYGLYVWDDDSCGYAHAEYVENCTGNKCVDDNWRCVDGYTPTGRHSSSNSTTTWCEEDKYFNLVHSFVSGNSALSGHDVELVRVYPRDIAEYSPAYIRVVDNTTKIRFNIDMDGKLLGFGSDGTRGDWKIHVTNWEYNQSPTLKNLVDLTGTQNSDDKYFILDGVQLPNIDASEFLGRLSNEGIDIIGISSSKNDGRLSPIYTQEAYDYAADAGLPSIRHGPMFWGGIEPDSWSGNNHMCSDGYTRGMPGAYRNNYVSRQFDPTDYYLIHPAQNGEDYVTVYFVQGVHNLNACNWLGDVGTSAVMCESGQPCYASGHGTIMYCAYAVDYCRNTKYDTIVGWSTKQDDDPAQDPEAGVERFPLEADISGLVTAAAARGDKEVKLYAMLVDMADYCQFNVGELPSSIIETPQLVRTPDNQCHASCKEDKVDGWETWPLELSNYHVVSHTVTCND